MNNKVVPFWPKKDRILNISELAKKISKTQEEKQKLYQETFTRLEKEKIMRRLYHIGNKTSNLYKLPLEMFELCDKNSLSRWRGVTDINLLRAYNKIKKQLDSEGFKTKVEIRRYKSKYRNGYFYQCGIIILGIKS